MTTVNRRHFLASLIALGAAIVLPDQATSAQVDKAWEKVLTSPWFFEVSDGGTIIEPEGQVPKINSDVYDNIWCGNMPDDLIREVDQYDELRSRFQQLAADELAVIEAQLDDHDLPPPERRRLLVMQAALQDEDDGWQAWVTLAGQKGLPRFDGEIEKWLAEPIDWSWSEFWPQGWSSQGAALSFFQQLDGEIVDALGVVIVEGEHPGSSYYAAELRAPVADADDIAQRLGLPFRFREEAA